MKKKVLSMILSTAMVVSVVLTGWGSSGNSSDTPAAGGGCSCNRNSRSDRHTGSNGNGGTQRGSKW